jgi:3-dehydroquinate synthase
MTKTIQHQSSKILFGTNLEDNLNEVLNSEYSGSKKIIITDDNVFDIWVENLITSVGELNGAEIIQLPAGEENKTIEMSYQVWETLTDYKIGRGDVIINFGGGVITDMGGFIASTYKRGIDFINIPTTLLSQVDASVGGKTGVDLGGFKNQIGVFALPTYVFVEYKYLNTLPQEQLVSGYAEMLKHGLIDDVKHWQNLIDIKMLTVDNLSEYIYDSVNIKHQIVVSDPTEKGKRKALNFGHTIGHAIEGFLLTNNQTVPHGYAVAWGMLVESLMSVKLNLLKESDYQIIKVFISSTYPVCTVNSSHINDLLELMLNDKKNRGGQINFTLLDGLGSCVINKEVDEACITECLEELLIIA